MLKHYRKSDWKAISEKYLPFIKQQFGEKPFYVEEIENEKARRWFDEIWLGGGLRIYTALEDKNGRKVYRFQVIYPKRNVEDETFTYQQACGMVSVLIRQFGHHTFYVEEIKDSFIRTHFDKLMRSLPHGSDYCILTDFGGKYEDDSGEHECFYIPNVVNRHV